MRSTEAQLLEAELMNSTPEHVYAWLKNRAEQSDEESYSGDEELEGALLTRGSALIDLGLARYGCSVAVVRKLLSDKRLRRAGERTHPGRPRPNVVQSDTPTASSGTVQLRTDEASRVVGTDAATAFQ